MLNALALVASVLAETIRPPVPTPVADWLSRNVVLVDGPHQGDLWSAEGAPYLVEPANLLHDDEPCTLVTVRKSQQTGVSILAVGWCMYLAENDPCNVIYGCPTLDFLQKLNREKLNPSIAAWSKLTGKSEIVPATTKGGSTTYDKIFRRGGLLSLANVNSVMDLSGSTMRRGIKDELSKWGDIPGYGDPEKLFFGRFTAFRRTSAYKILEISTPEIDTGDELGEVAGHCRIDRSFRRSDQRYWHVTCPACGGEWYFKPDRFHVRERRDGKPDQWVSLGGSSRIDVEPGTIGIGAYACDDCGHMVTEVERVPMVRAGRWIPTETGPDRHPGFHIDAFISLMMSFDAIAEEWRGVATETQRKDFANLILGRPYRFRGDAPDHKRLMERAELGLKREHVPPRGLILVAAADVQMRGIWLEVLAIAPDRQSWVVDATYLDGDTQSPDAEVFDRLRRATLDRTFPDAWGRERRIDALGVDSGYRSHVVYSWVRRNQRHHPDSGRDLILALDGRDGWGLPAIGTPKPVDIDLDGAKIKQGVKLWPIGTWPLKGEFYSQLRQTMGRDAADAVTYPPGYCHFGQWLGEDYYKQITAESLEDVVVRGRRAGRKWVRSGDNHLLDCRVYNLALAEYLGLSVMTEADWSLLARRRGLPDEAVAETLFTLAAARPEAARPAAPPPPRQEPPRPAATPSADWGGRTLSDWTDRR